jgi:hypothetical protein
MNVLQLATVLKQRLKLPPCKEFFLLIDGKTIPPQLLAMEALHRQHADPDGFLYFTYSSQVSVLFTLFSFSFSSSFSSLFSCTGSKHISRRRPLGHRYNKKETYSFMSVLSFMKCIEWSI